jgi:hypothetical protein
MDKMKLPKGMISDGSNIKVKKLNFINMKVVFSGELNLRITLACWCFRIGAWIAGIKYTLETKQK